MPRQNFSTRDISRYEWGATGTIFPSSCYPVSFFAIARPRDLSFAAARFQSALLLSRPFTLLLAGFRSVAASARLQHSCSEALPRSAFEVDVSSGHIFVTSPRIARLEPPSETVQVNLREYPRSLETTFLLQFKPNLGLSRRDLDYLRYYTVARFSRIIDSTSRQHVSRVRLMVLIINYLLNP